jgi:hypothetical protein
MLAGRRLCYFHDESTLEIRAMRSAKGGRAKAYPEAIGNWTARHIKSQEDVRAMLSDLAIAGMQGIVSTNRLSSMASIANCLSKVIEQGEMERRIAELEKRVGLRR